eukprot:5795525-Alexandrium_andersonii.AAC.1
MQGGVRANPHSMPAASSGASSCPVTTTQAPLQTSALPTMSAPLACPGMAHVFGQSQVPATPVTLCS